MIRRTWVKCEKCGNKYESDTTLSELFGVEIACRARKMCDKCYGKEIVTNEQKSDNPASTRQDG